MSDKQTAPRFTILKDFGIFKVIDNEKKLNNLFSSCEEYIAQSICDKFNAVNDEKCP